MVSRTIYILLILIFFGVYLYRFDTVNSILIEGQKVRITGRISEDPAFQNGRQRIVVGNIKIYTDQFPEYFYGDKIAAEGILARGKNGWYLAEVSEVLRIPEASNPLLVLRQKFLALYKKYLPEPHAALLSGIVLGTKSSLDFDFFEKLKKTGTLHIVVASGGNIALFAGSILAIFAPFIGRKKALVAALVASWFYVVLVGLQPPIIRAALMASIAFAAQALGRENDALRALLISAGVLLLWKPLWLLDAGFQLSFAATAGILFFFQPLNRLLKKLPVIFRQNLATTLAAQIAVSPILFLSFGQISAVAPVTNTLVLWTVPSIMVGGIVVGLFGLVFEPLGQVGAWFLWLFLEYFVQIIGLFS